MEGRCDVRTCPEDVMQNHLLQLLTRGTQHQDSSEALKIELKGNHWTKTIENNYKERCPFPPIPEIQIHSVLVSFSGQLWFSSSPSELVETGWFSWKHRTGAQRSCEGGAVMGAGWFVDGRRGLFFYQTVVGFLALASNRWFPHPVFVQSEFQGESGSGRCERWESQGMVHLRGDWGVGVGSDRTCICYRYL